MAKTAKQKRVLTPAQQAERTKKAKAKVAKITGQEKVVSAIRNEHADDDGSVSGASEHAFLQQCANHEQRFDKKAFAGHREFCLYKAACLEVQAGSWRKKATETRASSAKVKRLNKLRDQMASLMAELEAEGIEIEDDEDDDTEE